MPFYRAIVKHRRHNAAAWRYLFNMGSTLAYRHYAPVLAGEVGRVVRDLCRDGVAMSSVANLLPSAEVFAELAEAAARIESDQDEQIATARARIGCTQIAGAKAFLYAHLGDKPKLDVDSVFARFALQSHLRDVANGYFRMLTQLRYYNLWRSFASQEEASESQLWHRDREDLQILKVFVHFSDVTDGAGPFTYAPGTHLRGRVKSEPAYTVEGGVRRSTDDQMATVVPKENWVVARGSKGTIVFADTHGYHKGGLAREIDRLLYTCMYTSPSSQCQDHFDRTGVRSLPADPMIAVAVSPPGWHGMARSQ